MKRAGCKADGLCRSASICFVEGCIADKATAPVERDVDAIVVAVMKRANQLAPNSNFKIDGGIEGVKFRNIVQALIEELRGPADGGAA